MKIHLHCILDVIAQCIARKSEGEGENELFFKTTSTLFLKYRHKIEIVGIKPISGVGIDVVAKRHSLHWNA